MKTTHLTYVHAQRTLLGVSAAAALFAAAFGYVIFMGIRRNMKEVVELNTNLEGIVKARTEALAARERSLRLVLDSTGDGIVGVRADGTLAGDNSAAAERWFGKPRAGGSTAEYLFPSDAHRQALFRMSLDQLLEGYLPWGLLLDQMPKRAERDGVVLDLEYKGVAGEGSELAMLILARDVTARVRSEQAEMDAREQQSLIGKLLSDRQGFASFVSDSERLIESLGSEKDPTSVRRNLHTLKGNVAIFGLLSVALVCHQIEGSLDESDGMPAASAVSALGELFHGKLQAIEDFLVGLDRTVLQVATDDHSALVDSLLQRKDYREILQMVETWSWPRTSERLERMKAQVEYVAERLEKSIRVEIEHNDLRMPAAYLERFWPTMTHVLRNAVDHGVDSSEERVLRRKPEEAKISLRTWQTDEEFLLEVADDGGGIDTEGVLRSAKARGMQLSPDQNLVDLIFADGLSTREEVTELSGRGVGLAATRVACEAEGGRVEVLTESGKGTRFVFHFRRPDVPM